MQQLLAHSPTEGTDYTVDYTAGRVKILNRQLIDAKTPIEVSLQGGDALSQQRKTLIGLIQLPLL